MIEPALIKLLQGDRFYADLLMRLKRVYTDRIPTAAVSLEGGGTLYINPEFWSANEAAQVQILTHECLHLLFDHIGRAKECGAGPIFNVAADLAINDLIPGFPNQAIVQGKLLDLATVTNFKTKQFPDMQHRQAFEYYVEYLRQQGGNGAGSGQPMDDHSQWGDSKLTPEESRAVVRDLVEKAIANTKHAGKEVPSVVRPYIEELFNSDLSWEEILRSVPEHAEVAYYESSRKRRNRRYGLDFPGEKVVRKCQVTVGFDVSGSISDEIVTKFGGVLNEICQKADVTVLFFDHAIQKEIVYEPGCLDNGIPGGGGTNFAPVFDRAKELDSDALIMLTDGMCADQFDQPSYYTVWGILDGYTAPVAWGRSVVIK